MKPVGLARWWEGLGARERGLVSVGAAFVAAVLVYLWLWAPAADGIRRLRVDLPELRAQNASMQAMADEAAQLRAATGNAAPVATGDRMAAVRRSLERAGLWSPGAVAPAVAAPSAQAQPIRTLSVGGTVETVTAAAPTRTAPPEIVADGDRVRVRFDDVDYGVWIAWLAAAETELSARASRVVVTTNAPKAPVGHVRAEASLDWARPAPSAAPRS